MIIVIIIVVVISVIIIIIVVVVIVIISQCRTPFPLNSDPVYGVTTSQPL